MNDRRFSLYSKDELIARSMTLSTLSTFLNGYLSMHYNETLIIKEEPAECCCKLDESYSSVLNSIVGD